MWVFGKFDLKNTNKNTNKCWRWITRSDQHTSDIV